MRNMLVVAAVLALASSTLSGQETSTKTQAARPIAALGWLVGGVWTADASKMGGGMQRIETRYTWSDNNAYLRFNTHFVTDKTTLRNYDGQFFWNPEQSTLAMWYMDARNTITQGPVQVEGDVTQLSFRATNFEGKMADLRVDVTRKTNDRYTWTLEEKDGASWKQLASLEYLRAVEK
jgi:hypothetical protein